jgi:uncharacterized repeat protein (TIGR01451 family)
VTVSSTNDPTYYVVVYAVALGAPSVSYTVSAVSANFALNSVTPSSVANSGPVTLQILGDQLATNDTYTLSGPGGAFAATAVQSTDPTVAYATFNLGGATAGLYSLKVTEPGGSTLTLTNAISAVSITKVAAAPSFSVQLELPPAFRKGRLFDGTVAYHDAGEIDMPSPILVVSSGGQAEMAVQGSTNYSTSDLVLIAASFDGPAGTLTPDKDWNIGFSVLDPNCGGIPLAVGYETAQATNLIDYTALETLVRPPGYCATSWAQIWTSFQAKAGPTWGTFVTLMDSYATQMALANAPSPFYVLQDVLGFAFADLASANAACVNGSSLLPPQTVVPAGPTVGPSQNLACVISGDPNQKFATGIGLPDWVAEGEAITYTIEFANDTNASAPAQMVTITDPLATNLDWSTLQITTIAFNNAMLNIPSGVQTFSTLAQVSTDPNPVTVNASLNPATGVLTWSLVSTDPVTGQLVTDPLAGFLPPDNAQGQGEGFVTYTIQPKAGLPTGTQIMNQASIVFDLNAAIATPTTTNLVDSTPPTSSMSPLLTGESPPFTVAWSGQDVGSGVAGFDIYVATNGGAWTPWLIDTTNTSALFSGPANDTYAFYSVAYDEVGNVEANPIIPGATTGVQTISFSIARASAGALTLTWSQGTLLQTTNLAGGWTTNTTALSPYTVAPTNSQMFFKVLN